MKYAIVIPVKNEAENIGTLLDNIICQSHKPLICLVLDDGSEDETLTIVQEIMNKHTFINLIKNEGKLQYELGSHIVRLFEKGLKVVLEKYPDLEFVVKMDADISFNPDVFENISREINNNPGIGIISPLPFQVDNNGRKIFLNAPEWHTNGAFKIYNVNFLKEIGSIPKGLGWDCADNVLAISKGYKTILSSKFHYKQNRPIGRFSVNKGNFRQGKGAYSLNYNLFYLLLRGLHDLFKKPFIIGTIYYWIGYFSGFFKRTPHLLNKTHTKLLRKLFWQSFFIRFRNKDFLIFKPQKK